MGQYEFSALLWRWKGDAPAAWHFVTIPDDVAAQIKFFTGARKGFGTVRVSARIGKAQWNTSVFPDKASGSFLLPVKAGVRKALGLVDGQTVQVVLDLDL